MDITRHIYILTVIFSLMFPSKVWAQSFDPLTLESMIADHKRIRSILLVRSVVEQSNEVLHKNCKESDKDYEEVNLQLDRYTRCFDIIDIIYSSASTVFRAKNTYEDVKERIEGYKALLDKYNELCLRRGNVLTSDTLIVSISRHTIELIIGDCGEIITSLTDLALYASGTVTCSTADLMDIVEQIDQSLVHMRKIVDEAYFRLWQYITTRTGYWTKNLYHSKTMKEVADEAIERWLQNTHGLDY